MKSPFKNLLYALLSMVLITALAPKLQAQREFRDFEIQALTVDTNTNAETELFLVPRIAYQAGDLSWHVEFVNVSGTTGGTAYLEYSNDLTGTLWHVADSYAFSGTSDTLFNKPNFPAARVRLRVVSSGSQVTRVLNYVKWVRRP